MKLEDVVEVKKETYQTSTQLYKEDYLYLKKNKILLKKLIHEAIKDLKKQNGDETK